MTSTSSCGPSPTRRWRSSTWSSSTSADGSRTERIAQGSLTQCPVNPRDVLRAAVREAAHGIVFVHNHPSGQPSPSPEDLDLTERLRAGADLLGFTGRDHVIVAAGGYYSFVEAGRWRR